MVGFEEPLASTRDVYRGLGVASLLVAAVYLALYHLLLAPRCAAPPVAPPRALLQGKQTRPRNLRKLGLETSDDNNYCAGQRELSRLPLPLLSLKNVFVILSNKAILLLLLRLLFFNGLSLWPKDLTSCVQKLLLLVARCIRQSGFCT